MESDFTIWNMCNTDSDRLQRSDKGITKVEKIEKPLDTDKTDKHALTDRQTDRQTEIIVVGAIGNNARQNRDNMRVLSRKGLMFALKAHIQQEQSLVLKKYS